MDEELETDGFLAIVNRFLRYGAELYFKIAMHALRLSISRPLVYSRVPMITSLIWEDVDICQTVVDETFHQVST